MHVKKTCDVKHLPCTQMDVNRQVRLIVNVDDQSNIRNIKDLIEAGTPEAKLTF